MSVAFICADSPAASIELVGLGNMLAAETHCLAFTPADAEALNDCGANSVVLLEGAERPIEGNAVGIAALLKERLADLFLVGATAQGRDLAARVAAYLDCAMASDVSSVDIAGDGVVVTRNLYGGTVVEEVALPFPAVLTVPAGVGEPASGEAPVEAVAVERDNRVELVDEQPIQKTGINLKEATVVLGVGMGFKQKDDLALAEEVAEAMGAGIGCSRALVEERHWLAPEQYIGLSGLSITPDLYIAVGISGQVQHVAGIRGAKVIAAINADTNAPIFNAADYAIIGDLYEVLPQLAKAVRAL